MALVSSSKKRKLRKVSSSRKRKLGTEESSETQAVCIEKPEHLSPPKSNDGPSIPSLLVQESLIEENMDELDDLPRREDVPTSASLVCSDVQTEKVESVAGGVPVRVSVDASMLCTSANCLTVDSTTLIISNSVDITAPLVASANVSGQVDYEGFEYAENLKSEELGFTSVQHSQSEDVPTEVQTENVESVAEVMLVDATMTSTSDNCLIVDCTALTISTPTDITPCLVESTSVSSKVGDDWFECVQNRESNDIPTFDCTTFSTPTDICPPHEASTSVSSPVGNDWFEYVENFKIPKVYADVYKKILCKYGHIATRKVIKSNDDIILVCVASLMKIASTMETIRGVDLSAVLLESWEGDIRDAETLQFNIKCLHELLGRLKNSWNSSFSID